MLLCICLQLNAASFCGYIRARNIFAFIEQKNALVQSISSVRTRNFSISACLNLSVPCPKQSTINSEIENFISRDEYLLEGDCI